MEQTLGSRMKEYEYVTRNYLVNRVPIIVRIDGKAFHKFTRGLDKPCDKIFMESMKKTTVELCKQVQGTVMGYTQSDEISLVLMNTSDRNSELWFNNNLSKIISVSASIATVEFNKTFMNLGVQYELDNNVLFDNKNNNHKYSSKYMTANFDSRAFNIPREEVINYFIWRQRDCQKNAVNSAARTMFSHKQLQGLNQKQLKEKMLTEKGLNFDKVFADVFKNGMIVIKEPKERIGYDNFGKQYFATSKQWVVKNGDIIFEDDRDEIEDYLERMRG